MAFRFPLQSVLRLRRSLERQEEQRLQALASVVSRLTGELEACEQADLAERRAALAEMEVYCSGAQLQFRLACQAGAERVITLLRVQLLEAEGRRLAQLKIYQAALQRREILERLRKHQIESYERKSARRQQQDLDEAFLLRQFLEARD